MRVNLALQGGQLRTLLRQIQLIEPRLILQPLRRHFRHLVQQRVDFLTEQFHFAAGADVDAVLQLVVQVIFDEGGQLFHWRHDAALDVQVPHTDADGEHDADQHSQPEQRHQVCRDFVLRHEADQPPAH